MIDRKTVIIVLPNGKVTHLNYYGEPLIHDKTYYFNVGVGIMVVSKGKMTIDPDDHDLEYLETEFKRILYNQNGETKVIEPNAKEGTTKGKITTKKPRVWTEDVYDYGTINVNTSSVEKELVDADGKKWKVISTETKLE